ncbi:hypothetical protein OROMI_002085 [Orobanche minor]
MVLQCNSTGTGGVKPRYCTTCGVSVCAGGSAECDGGGAGGGCDARFQFLNFLFFGVCAGGAEAKMAKGKSKHNARLASAPPAQTPRPVTKKRKFKNWNRASQSPPAPPPAQTPPPPAQTPTPNNKKKRKNKKRKKRKRASQTPSHSALPPAQTLTPHVVQYRGLTPPVPVLLHCKTIFVVQYGSPVGKRRKNQYPHGLWQYPMNNNAQQNPDPRDLHGFSGPLTKILRRIMPNLKGDGSTKSDHVLWKHEWLNHGRYLGMTLDEYFYTIKFLYDQCLRIFMLSRPCSTCSRVFVEDLFGDHAVSCAGMVGTKHRHNLIRDTLLDVCFRSGISAGKEVNIGLRDGSDGSLRPADLLLYAWDRGRDVCVDLTGSSHLTRSGILDFVPGQVVAEAAKHKCVKYRDLCAVKGYGFLPFSFYTLGELDADDVALLVISLGFCFGSGC